VRARFYFNKNPQVSATEASKGPKSAWGLCEYGEFSSPEERKKDSAEGSIKTSEKTNESQEE